MLAKKYRLTKEKDFKSIFRGKGRAYGRFFALKFTENEKDYPCFAVVASLKVSKSAVVRNRLQRQVREIIKSVFSRFKSHYDIMVNISPKSKGQKYEDLEKDLIALLKKAKLI